ncbi:unnamed protein product [Paramecium pentaurelia]|uniref:Transmembrane protein n=1 Tax=Paramecium pentaurelia TaxID=43138 RepID=A0A8S1XKL0_9CILI|nr:unnamed protein product [Paramecium pentaurelia]
MSKIRKNFLIKFLNDSIFQQNFTSTCFKEYEVDNSNLQLNEQPILLFQGIFISFSFFFYFELVKKSKQKPIFNRVDSDLSGDETQKKRKAKILHFYPRHFSVFKQSFKVSFIFSIKFIQEILSFFFHRKYHPNQKLSVFGTMNQNKFADTILIFGNIFFRLNQNLWNLKQMLQKFLHISIHFLSFYPPKSAPINSYDFNQVQEISYPPFQKSFQSSQLISRVLSILMIQQHHTMKGSDICVRIYSYDLLGYSCNSFVLKNKEKFLRLEYINKQDLDFIDIKVILIIYSFCLENTFRFKVLSNKSDKHFQFILNKKTKKIQRQGFFQFELGYKNLKCYQFIRQ